MVGECAGIPVRAKLSQLILRYRVMYKSSDIRIGTRRKISFKTDELALLNRQVVVANISADQSWQRNIGFPAASPTLHKPFQILLSSLPLVME